MDTASLKTLIGTDRDSALLRVTIGNALLQEENPAEAEEQFAEAVRMETGYTAAWKQLGKVRLSLDNIDGAREAWQSGIEAARENGDKQAEREMQVFLRRLDKQT